MQAESQAVLQKHAPEYRLAPVGQPVQALNADVVQEALAHEKWQDIAILLLEGVIQNICDQINTKPVGTMEGGSSLWSATFK